MPSNTEVSLSICLEKGVFHRDSIHKCIGLEGKVVFPLFPFLKGFIEKEEAPIHISFSGNVDVVKIFKKKGKELLYMSLPSKASAISLLWKRFSVLPAMLQCNELETVEVRRSHKSGATSIFP